MFKKAPKAKGFRKREADSDDGADGASAVVRQAPPTRKRGNAFSTKQDDDGSDDEVVNKGTAVFESSRSAAPMSHRGGAFETVETDTAVDRDARTLLERQIQMQKDGLTNDDTGLYQGAASYKSYVKINDAQVGANKFTGTKGPIRAPQFARATCRFDYQPDVCKDYKDTGYCGYGDGCKFMHDRGQYKTGWQLEQEFKFTKERQKEREMAGKMGDDSDEEREKDKYTIRGGNDDDLPFACHLCRGP
ncbi:hypothetical protein M885DRAFT_563037 [Pelagophyceae sp. CCMP2097]|nr:hypothetical protein M885DRAFT_563037 [Pelagophyceae sp. CCMP2097]